MTDHPTKDAPPVEAVIDELRQGGEVDSAGTFTLDREVARQRLSELQLNDPMDYLLLLVQAAVAREATTLTFDIDADDMRLTFDGRGFTAQDLDLLYHEPLSSGGDERDAGRRELGLALNAALSLEPRWIRLSSGDDDTGARIEIRPRQRDRIERLEHAEPGTRIHVKYTHDRVRRSLASYGDALAETDLLAARCRYLSAMVVVNGKTVSGRPLVPDAVAAVELAGHAFEGRAGFVGESDKPAALRILQRGVWITEHPVEEAPPGFLAVVQADGLKRDLSQLEVVRDERYASLRFEVENALGACLVILTSVLDTPEESQRVDFSWIRRTLRRALHRYDHQRDVEGDRANPTAAALAGIPLWEELSPPGEDGRTYTLAELQRRIDEGAKLTCVPDEDLHPRPAWLDDTLASSPNLWLRLETAADTRYLETLVGLEHCSPSRRREPEDAPVEQASHKAARTILVGAFSAIFIVGLMAYLAASSLDSQRSTEGSREPSVPEPVMFPEVHVPSIYEIEEMLGLSKPEPETVALAGRCDRGEGAACHDLALRYEQGKGGLVRNTARARELMRKGCNLGHTPSCGRLNRKQATSTDPAN